MFGFGSKHLFNVTQNWIIHYSCRNRYALFFNDLSGCLTFHSIKTILLNINVVFYFQMTEEGAFQATICKPFSPKNAPWAAAGLSDTRWTEQWICFLPELWKHPDAFSILCRCKHFVGQGAEVWGDCQDCRCFCVSHGFTAPAPSGPGPAAPSPAHSPCLLCTCFGQPWKAPK